MHKLLIRGIACVALAFMATGTLAQESKNRVAAHTDWSVFEAKEPAQCWSVSSPKETINTRDGRTVAVKRGDILLFVSYIPASGVKGQVSFTGGYPFKKGSTVTLTVGDNKFELFTEGEMGWAASEEEDARIIAAFKRGSEAVLTAQSARGTKTKDTFSLLGFTAAVEEAAKRCGS